MRKYGCFILLSIILSCENSTVPSGVPNNIIIKGMISTESSENLIHFNHEAIELSTDEEGNFSDTLPISSPQYVRLSFGDISFRIYAKQGDEIDISVSSTISFSGSNAAINRYLLEYDQSDIERKNWEYSKHEEVFTQNEVEYVSFRDSIRDQKLTQLEELPAGTEEFQDFHRKDIEFQYQHDVARYPNYHGYLFNDYEPTTLITRFYDGVNLDNEAYALNYSGYRALTDLIFEKQAEELIENGQAPLDAHLAVLDEINSPTTLHRRLNRALYFYTVETKDIEATKNEMLALAKQDRTKTMIEEHSQVINRLKAGSPAPPFNLENYNGGTTSLADLKGKYVYIDVWATWCGPCLKELPSLKEIEKEFEHANITFVSVSLDAPRFYSMWREMVETEDLGGIQLIVENGWDSDFTTDYGIHALPRFILLDDQGNFVSADVEKPSNAELRARLLSLGI